MSVEAEQAVLGSILIKPAECFEALAGMLSPDDFAVEEHRLIYAAMQEMFLLSKKIDVVTLIHTLVQEGVRDEAGGTQYIAHIAEIVPSAANVKDYAQIVHEKSLLRKLIGICDEVSAAAYSEQGSAVQLLDRAEQLFFDLSEKRGSGNLRHIKEIIGGVYQNIVKLSENKSDLTGIRTGFSGLDRVLVQMSKGDLLLIGARPGMGKTSFATNIAVNAAKATRKNVCIFSIEMSCDQIVTRMLSSEALVDSYALRSGEIKANDWERLAEAASQLAGCEIYVDDTSSITVMDMKSKLRRVKNLGLVVVDYLQLMQSSRRIENRVQEVSDISRNLKIMAKELGVPIICCAQLSRGPEGRTSKKPMLSDLRDSGAIEQDADVVMFLYRDEYYKETTGDNSEMEANTAEVIVAKNRHGSTGNIKMGWIGQFTKFRTLDEASH
ncbi:MAG: replicative DNA helicase [Eubacteriales bacterium]